MKILFMHCELFILGMKIPTNWSKLKKIYWFVLLRQGATIVLAYIPNDRWFDFYTVSFVDTIVQI